MEVDGEREHHYGDIKKILEIDLREIPSQYYEVAKTKRNFIPTTVGFEGEAIDGITHDIVENSPFIADSLTTTRRSNVYPNRSKTVQIRNFAGRPNILVFRNVSCEPIYPEVLLYNRVFKTGSTSITRYIQAVTQNMAAITVKTGTTEDWYKTGDHSSYPEDIEKYGNRLERIRLLFLPKKTKDEKGVYLCKYIS
jgi:hypothetical protein